MTTGRPASTWVARVLPYALLAWIGASGIFFYGRFTFSFVLANLDAIRRLWGE